MTGPEVFDSFKWDPKTDRWVSKDLGGAAVYKERIGSGADNVLFADAKDHMLYPTWEEACLAAADLSRDVCGVNGDLRETGTPVTDWDIQ